MVSVAEAAAASAAGVVVAAAGMEEPVQRATWTT